MKEELGEKIKLKICTVDSPEAKKYNLKSSTNVLLDGKAIPLDTVLSKTRLRAYLKKKLSI
ncbi:MAG: hypothetical protein NTY64_17885 [Deltaproteobacteria bacterium]|nr:hypothetical protein [Deltaproteobacteria bacterium]